MRRPTAAVGSAVFFLVAPGVVVGLIPWLLTRWQAREPLPYWASMRVLGGLVLVAGLIALVQAFVRFVVEGLRDTGAGCRARASGRRRGVSLRPQPHVRGGTGGPCWSGAALGLARSAAVRRGRLAGRRGVRALVRGTHPHPPLRRGLRSLPARSACLVAPPASMGTRRAWRTRRRVMRLPTTVTSCSASRRQTSENTCSAQLVNRAVSPNKDRGLERVVAGTRITNAGW
jgi:hypothetical protein